MCNACKCWLAVAGGEWEVAVDGRSRAAEDGLELEETGYDIYDVDGDGDE